IDLMVRSGARAHWLRAALPTSRRPSSDRPTKEGRIGSPLSSVKTWGWPSRTMATSLLVVPRSMPTIGSGMLTLSKGLAPLSPRGRGEQRSGFRDAHLREAEHAAAAEVAAAHLLNHLGGRPARAGHDLHDFHRLGVE